MFELAKKTTTPVLCALLATCFAGSASAQIWRLDSWASYGGNPQLYGHQQSNRLRVGEGSVVDAS